jgi:hypothetical protein
MAQPVTVTGPSELVGRREAGPAAQALVRAADSPTPGGVVLGVDLAWGEHAKTGVCAIVHGQVVESGTARTDAENIAWIERYRAEAMTVAVDAPLVVPNDTGARGCERTVTRLWGGAWAGTHPANRRRPEFRDGGRAAPAPRKAFTAATTAWTRRRARSTWNAGTRTPVGDLDRMSAPSGGGDARSAISSSPESMSSARMACSASRRSSSSRR